MVARLVPDSGAPSPFGASVTNRGVNFAVYSEQATDIWVCLFDSNDKEVARIVLDGQLGNIHFGLIEMDIELTYGLRADGPYNPSLALHFDPDKLLLDPYAKHIDRPFHQDPRLTMARGDSGDTAPLMPKAIVDPVLPEPILPMPTKQGGLIYELNVKSYTKQHRGIPAALRGTVPALATEPVIRHLDEIGVDVVELMPVAAWMDERHLPPLGLSNAWGYNPVGYFVPEPRLMPNGISDMRATTDAFRAAGLPVILDVVYNHTGESDRFGPVLSMKGLDALTYYWHRPDGEELALVNDAGTGNTLRCDHPAVEQLVIESLRFWVEYGGVSGFRFDLAPVLGKGDDGFFTEAPLLDTMRADPVLSKCLLIVEPWDASGHGYHLGDFRQPFGEWNDRYRDDVRAFWRGDAFKMGDFVTRVAGSSDVFGGKDLTPDSSVNMLAVHDGFTLSDLVSYEHKHNEPNGEGNRDGHSHNLSWNNGIEGPTDDPAILAARDSDVRALLATLFTSLGTPLLQQGDEFGRSQRGMNNAYAQDNEITWLDWDSADEKLIAYTGALKRFRDEHAALTADQFLTGQRGEDGIRDVIWWHHKGREYALEDWQNSRAGVIGMQLARAGDEILVWYNRKHKPKRAKLPPLQIGSRGWKVALTSAVKPPRIVKSEMKLAPRSVTLLVPRQI